MTGSTTAVSSWFDFNRSVNPTARWFYRASLLSYLLLGVGYIARGQGLFQQEQVTFLLGVLPNLLGSFATPLILSLIGYAQRKQHGPVTAWPGLLLANAITFAAAVIMEWLHVVFSLGFWDPYDLLASLVGGLASLAFFGLLNRETAALPVEHG